MRYEAPAKVNLSLHVRFPRSDGYHPIESLVQTVDWVDTLEFVEGSAGDILETSGLDVGDQDNLVLEAIAAVRRDSKSLPPQRVTLDKSIPVGAGLGGGSADAAAALRACSEIVRVEAVEDLATRIGADVPFFLVGGSAVMAGVGEVIESTRALQGFAVAIAVPDFALSTAAVYGQWDEMEGPTGEVTPEYLLPPGLRQGMPMRNDLTPAAIALEPRLGDFMAELRATWGGAVQMTGSGSGCFGFFPSLDEARDAASAVGQTASSARGSALRKSGVKRLD